MIQYKKDVTDVLPFFSYQISQYMIKSLLYRKNAKIERTENSALITWGPSLIIGGEFSGEMCKMLRTKLQNQVSPCWIYSPDGEWKLYIESTFSSNLKEKQVNLYQHNGLIDASYQTENSHIIQTTREWFQSDLSTLIKNEIYSYVSVDDFLQNGFGLILVINDKVCGYCLSEYSIDNECAISIWIDEKHREQGYAKMMTRLFLHHNKDKNWNVFWGCESDNMPSNKLAQTTGFEIVSSLKYYEWKK
ncbi:MAG: GNAT family N-acetyltransferase [Defluviitaleaceae bacterium]|nr:GNAT family N-acetyltransferase [Defluviitaleaceae bacterium]